MNWRCWCKLLNIENILLQLPCFMQTPELVWLPIRGSGANWCRHCDKTGKNLTVFAQHLGCSLASAPALPATSKNLKVLFVNCGEDLSVIDQLRKDSLDFVCRCLKLRDQRRECQTFITSFVLLLA